jgi:hypothetical protein
MDPTHFDHLARLLGGRPGSRRQALAALAAAVGLARRAAPAAAFEWCERNGIGMKDCGPDCDKQTGRDCRCYDPATHYCIGGLMGTCRHGEVACEGSPGYFYCVSEANCACDGPFCKGRCCAAGQVCEDDQCTNACAARRGTRAAGVCCNPATETVCGDRCCPKEGRCCLAGNGAASCCPAGKTCCVGPDATACCDPGEAYCCSGVCCANHFACVGEPIGTCRADCPDGGAKCGRACCRDGQVCFDEATGACGGCGPAETPCGGRACCAEGQTCKDGRCVQDCPKGRVACGDACCARNETCKGGRCVKKRRKK